MTSKTDLNELLANLQPQLNTGEFVFCLARLHDIPPGVEPLMRFHEHEGLTVILRRGQAEELGLHYTLVCAWITLSVHSALESIGLTAAVTTALAAANIPCNVVAATYHDHLFVPLNEGENALAILLDLSKNSLSQK